MALLDVQRVSKAGIADFSGALSAADAAGDSVKAASNLLIVVENGDASSHTVTITAPTNTSNDVNYGALPVSDIVLTVGAGDIGVVAIPLGYGNGANEFAWTYDAVTSVTAGVFSLAP